MSSKFIPNSFQVPNVIVDEMMAVLGDTELRCYLLLIRKTTGWQKEMDFISNTQFQKYTGRGKTSITHALQKLQERGLVFELDSKEGTTNCYALNADQFTNWTSSKSELVQKVNGGSSESERVPVQKVNTQKTNTKPTKQKTTTTAPAPADFAEQQSQSPAETGQDDSPMVSAVFAPYFAMPLDWQPADPDMVAERLRFSQIPALDTDLCQDALLDFAEFWYARPDVVKTAAQWDAAFLQSVRGYRAKRGHLYHRDGSRKDSGSLKAAAGAADYVPAVSKTAQKTAWLRETGQARLDGKTSGSLKPVIFATVCEGLAQMLETGASKGAPMLEGLPAVLAQWEASLTATLAEDADGSRVSAAFAALIGQGDMFPTVPMLTQNLPPLLPQFRQPETPKQGGRRLGRGDGARAEALSRIGKKQGAQEAQEGAKA